MFSNNGWMVWNLTLAAVPLFLSLAIFGGRGHIRSPIWWLGVAAFIVFLPNAPYVLTDVLWLRDDLNATSSQLGELAVAAVYGAFFALGFGAYIIAVSRAVGWFRRVGAGRYAWLVEFSLHLLSAIGIYLGRVLRLNSWDVLGGLDGVLEELARPRPLLLIAVALVITSVPYYVFKLLVLTTRQKATPRVPTTSSGA